MCRRLIRHYFGETKNERFFKERVFFKDPEDVNSRSALSSASLTVFRPCFVFFISLNADGPYSTLPVVTITKDLPC